MQQGHRPPCWHRRWPVAPPDMDWSEYQGSGPNVVHQRKLWGPTRLLIPFAVLRRRLRLVKRIELHATTSSAGFEPLALLGVARDRTVSELCTQATPLPTGSGPHRAKYKRLTLRGRGHCVEPRPAPHPHNPGHTSQGEKSLGRIEDRSQFPSFGKRSHRRPQQMKTASAEHLDPPLGMITLHSPQNPRRLPPQLPNSPTPRLNLPLVTSESTNTNGKNPGKQSGETVHVGTVRVRCGFCSTLPCALPDPSAD